MRFRGTLVLLVVGLALGAYVYFYEYKGAPKREEAKQQENRIWKFDSSTVQQTRPGNARPARHRRAERRQGVEAHVSAGPGRGFRGVEPPRKLGFGYQPRKRCRAERHESRPFRAEPAAGDRSGQDQGRQELPDPVRKQQSDREFELRRAGGKKRSHARRELRRLRFQQEGRRSPEPFGPELRAV